MTMTIFIVDKFDWLAYNESNSREKFFKMNLLFIDHDKRGGRMKLQDLASVRSGLVICGVSGRKGQFN